MQREGSTNRVLTGNVVLLSAQKVFDSFSGCSFVSPTSYGNIFGAFSGVKFMVTSPGPEGAAGAGSFSTGAAEAFYSGIFTFCWAAGFVSWVTWWSCL